MSLPYFTPPNHHNSTLSDINEVYYSDSEGSKCLILPQSKTFLNDSNLENFNDFQRKTLATSSPLNNKAAVIKKNYRSYNLKHKNILNTLSNKTIKTFKKQNRFIKSNSLQLLKNNSIINNINNKKKYSLQYDKLQQFKDHKITKNPTPLLKPLCLSNNNNTYNSANKNKIMNYTQLNRLEKAEKENNDYINNLSVENSKPPCCLEPLDSRKKILSYDNDFEEALIKIFEIPEKTTEEDSINITAYNAVHSILINNSINIDINKKEGTSVNTFSGKLLHKNSHDFINLKPKSYTHNTTSISVPPKEDHKSLILNANKRKINEFNYSQKDEECNKLNSTVNVHGVLNSDTSNNNHSFNYCSSDMTMDTINDVNNAPDTNIGFFSTKYNEPNNFYINNKDGNISNNVNIILDEKDSTELLQLNLDLKMFEEKIVPYLNSLKSDMLGLMMNHKHRPTKCVTRGSSNIYDVLRSNKRCISLKNINLNAMNCKNQLDPIEDTGCPKYAKLEMDKLNLLSTKLKTIDNLKKQFNFLFENNQLKHNDNNQNNSGTSSLSSSSLLLSSTLTESSIRAPSQVSSTETNDSLNQNRDIHKECSVSPISNDIVNYSILSSKPELNNSSLKHVSESPIKKHSLSPVVVMDTNWSYNNQKNTSSISGISNLQEVPESNDFLVDCNNGINNCYWLRSTPKQTRRFVAPIKVAAVKKRNNRLKNTNDIFVLKGRGNSKSFVRYKAHSVVNPETKSFPKELLFKSKIPKRKQSNTSNTELFRPLINNCKPCACGIFKSQIPSCWTGKLHNLIHENLYKLNFKPHESLKVVERVSQKEFSYDIIKTTNISSSSNKNVLKVLEIYEEFINLELNFVKSTVGGNRDFYVYLAIHPNSTVVGYLKVETLKNACTLDKGKLTDNLVVVKFGVSKLWVMVSYRRLGIATKLLQRFQDDEKLSNDSIAFAHHGSTGIEFINNYFSNNSILVY
ncbi:putative uncharacterized protein DDB_G0282499 isoform X1 [Adelges cooleyi]|uniref:putative uncharacterized protein DDB_G0282499 isoform X1 n=1 Tax=Adelges cooleyi TaxID=133065 RepID=UPI00217F8D51|nr:putative uncharacterized protein DDB_G0282499 isoform X1 [Adelges cooleyi]